MIAGKKMGEPYGSPAHRSDRGDISQIEAFQS